MEERNCYHVQGGPKHLITSLQMAVVFSHGTTNEDKVPLLAVSVVGVGVMGACDRGATPEINFASSPGLPAVR